MITVCYKNFQALILPLECLAEIPKSCMNSAVDKGSVEDTTENIRDGDCENLYTLVQIVLS